VKGKEVRDFVEAYGALEQGCDFALVPATDHNIHGFRVVMNQGPLTQTAQKTEGFQRNAPAGFFSLFINRPPLAQCYLVEEERPEIILQKLRSAGLDVELKN